MMIDLYRPAAAFAPLLLLLPPKNFLISTGPSLPRVFFATGSSIAEGEGDDSPLQLSSLSIAPLTLSTSSPLYDYSYDIDGGGGQTLGTPIPIRGSPSNSTRVDHVLDALAHALGDRIVSLSRTSRAEVSYRFVFVDRDDARRDYGGDRVAEDDEAPSSDDGGEVGGYVLELDRGGSIIARSLFVASALQAGSAPLTQEADSDGPIVEQYRYRASIRLLLHSPWGGGGRALVGAIESHVNGIVLESTEDGSLLELLSYRSGGKVLSVASVETGAEGEEGWAGFGGAGAVGSSPLSPLDPNLADPIRIWGIALFGAAALLCFFGHGTAARRYSRRISREKDRIVFLRTERDLDDILSVGMVLSDTDLDAADFKKKPSRRDDEDDGAPSALATDLCSGFTSGADSGDDGGSYDDDRVKVGVKSFEVAGGGGGVSQERGIRKGGGKGPSASLSLEQLGRPQKPNDCSTR